MTRWILLIPLIAAAVACSSGRETEHICREALLDFSDSTAAHTLFLTARFAKNTIPDSASFEIRIISPSGKQASEHLVLPTNPDTAMPDSIPENRQGDIQTARTSAYCDYKWKYRSGIIPEEKGIWKITVIPENTPGLKDTGIISEKTENHERKRQNT